MEKNQIVFEEVEAKVSEMLGRLSVNERKQNVGLSKVERRMQRILNRLKRVVSASHAIAQNSKGELNADL